jgi:hypothetical protein
MASILAAPTGIRKAGTHPANIHWFKAVVGLVILLLVGLAVLHSSNWSLARF